MNGFVDIERSIIQNSTGIGLVTGQDDIGGPVTPGGSYSNVTDSQIIGSGIGASVGNMSVLSLHNTQVTGLPGGPRGEEWGIGIHGATVNMTGGSHVVGQQYGLYFLSANRTGILEESAAALIDNSVVQAIEGPTIKVDTNFGVATIADIAVRNGSTLLSGNGNLLEVVNGSTANFTVDNSRLTGNLVADDDSFLNVTLQNNAELTGDLINADNVAINSGARWNMVGDASVGALAMEGGSVTLGSAERFYTLSLGALSGNGMFNMHVDLAGNEGDLLSVNGEASGNHQLNVQNTGIEPTSLDIDPLRVVHTEGGDAWFSLVGGSVDLGAFSYQLEKQGDDWFIVGQGRTISPSTQSALALFNVAPTLWYGELSSLRSRMGELRNSGDGGGWIRAYGNQHNVSVGAGFGYRQRQQGLSFGVDTPVPVSNGQFLLGVLGGYSKSDLSLERGTSGKVDSYYLGTYGTWLMGEGYYLDAVIKLNQFRNQSDVTMTNGSKAKGRYNNAALGGSLEFGRHIKLQDEVFVEPFAQLSAVKVQGNSYTLDNGLKAKNTHTQSVLGKVGATLGRNLELKDGGVLQPYLKAALVHEFARNNDVRVNDNRFESDLFGSRAELGVGMTASLSENLSLHAEFDYMKGEHIEQPWGVNIGMRYGF
ncbi:autotransporter outer membrane beta-barrel domain-containing protein [Pseudomonas gingeri]|nr:autotransporter outer membrane beta-barrel domain-containing protein [Pseudomonas gingeri]NWE31990.1 autotransporter outer membrane beta-barrel domain-containing protein [Pseudomonas gingeri]NWE55817.1 autotransporter outer membrane beta-barrel domain-containing protein [Pseudomonas gingeri]NWF01545.1 autotransporter outer membrane beta-barrel domain-containing protein [Pseudomonas gingeri]